MPKIRALMTRSPLRDSGNEKRSEETVQLRALKDRMGEMIGGLADLYGMKDSIGNNR